MILCFMNPAVVRTAAQEAREFFDGHPREPLFPLVPNDSYVRACECPFCEKWVLEPPGTRGYVSELTWRFVNAVAREVAKTHPDRLVGSLAYARQAAPPKTVERLEPNVAVMHCKQRLMHWNAEYKKQSRTFIRRWTELRPRAQYVWEYYNRRSRAEGLSYMPMLAPHAIAEDLKWLKRYSSGEFLEAENDPTHRKVMRVGMFHLNVYVTARFYWDPDQDVDALLDEYYSLFYGPAAAPMKRFFCRLEALWTGQEARRLEENAEGDFSKNVNPWKVIYALPEVKKLFAMLDEAAESAAGQAPYAQRVAFMQSEYRPMLPLAQFAQGKQAERFARCPRTSRAPVFDGKLDDAAWRLLREPLDMVEQYAGVPPKQKTHWWLTRDEASLYLAVRAFEEELSHLRTECRERDESGIWFDDAIEIFLDPTAERERAYHFIISAAGVVWDAGSHGARRKRIEWNSGLRAAAGREENAWTLEIAIPFRDLGGAAKAGATWAVNVNRDRVCLPKVSIQAAKKACRHSAWSPTFGRSFTPERFGTVEFE